MERPSKLIVRNAHLNPMACDKNPMIGGPIKNPKNPILETEAKSILALPVAALRPTVPYIVGITDDTPNPTNINPILLTIICG